MHLLDKLLIDLNAPFPQRVHDCLRLGVQAEAEEDVSDRPFRGAGTHPIILPSGAPANCPAVRHRDNSRRLCVW